MAARFRAAGFPAADVQVLAPAPRKGNLVVRLRGSGAGRPVLFIGHLDVVEALRSDWSYDPFVLTEKDGYFYGRGTADMKGDVAAMTRHLPASEKGGRPPRPRPDPRPDGRRGRRQLQWRRLAHEESPFAGGRRVRRQHRRGRRPHQERQALVSCHAGG